MHTFVLPPPLSVSISLYLSLSCPDFHWYATIRLDIDAQSLTHFSNINISMFINHIYRTLKSTFETPFGEFSDINELQSNRFDGKIKVFRSTHSTSWELIGIRFLDIDNQGPMHTHTYGRYTHKRPFDLKTIVIE